MTDHRASGAIRSPWVISLGTSRAVQAAMRWFGVVMLLVAACGSRAEGPNSSPSQIATASATTTTSTVAPAPSQSPTLRPNPSAGPGVYTSITLAYRVELPAGWRRSACQSTRDPVVDGVDTFTSASIDEESATDIGSTQDVVVVRVEDNAAAMTGLQWLESGKMGLSSAAHFERATIDGRDGARIVPNDGSPSLAFAVPARGRMYAVFAGIRDLAARPAITSILSSFHVLSDAELADARNTFATPAPSAPRTAEAVAQTLANGFAQKDLNALASVAYECMTQGAESAGVGFTSSTRFFAELKTKLASGLAVSVQPTPLLDQQPTNATVRGTWRESGQPLRNVKFMLRKVGSTWYWDGVLYLLN